jgi:hypothetical protein
MVVTHALMTQLTVMRWARSYGLLVHSASAFNAKRRNQWIYNTKHQYGPRVNTEESSAGRLAR